MSESAPSRVIGDLGFVWPLGWLTVIRGDGLDRVVASTANIPEVTTSTRVIYVPFCDSLTQEFSTRYQGNATGWLGGIA